MAGRAKGGKAKSARAGRRRGGGIAFVVVGLAVFALMLFATPAFIILVVGMVPALVATIVDREPGRNATIAVSATNLAGVVPFVIELVVERASMADAIAMATDLFVVAMMYGAAAIGWVLVLGMPKVAAVYIAVTTQARIQSMRREQQLLVEEWGPDVGR